MFYTLDSWNRILHLGSQTCGIRVARPSEKTRERETARGGTRTDRCDGLEKERSRERERERKREREGEKERRRRRGKEESGIRGPGPRGPFRLSGLIPLGPRILRLLSLSRSHSLLRLVSCTLPWLQFMAVITSIGTPTRIKRFVRVHGPTFIGRGFRTGERFVRGFILRAIYRFSFLSFRYL